MGGEEEEDEGGREGGCIGEGERREGEGGAGRTVKDECVYLNLGSMESGNLGIIREDIFLVYRRWDFRIDPVRFSFFLL